MYRNINKDKWSGEDPDYRFSLANERTFLAWVRTAIALLATVVVLDQVALHTADSRVLRILCLLCATTACLVAGACYFRWRKNELAMRLAQSLPNDFLQPLLSISIFAIAVTLTLFVAR
ncbi:YidH family protein [Cupriavidus sp. TA19]|nr:MULTISPECIES: DUF202 domain-containing protein [unclassified Cupriavidus]